jgi:hypothetical protein
LWQKDAIKAAHQSGEILTGNVNKRNGLFWIMNMHSPLEKLLRSKMFQLCQAHYTQLTLGHTPEPEEPGQAVSSKREAIDSKSKPQERKLR